MGEKGEGSEAGCLVWHNCGINQRQCITDRSNCTVN